MGGSTTNGTEHPAPVSNRKLKDIRRDTIAASYESDILKELFVSSIVPLVLLELST